MHIELRELSLTDGQDLLDMLREIGPGESGFMNAAHDLTPEQFASYLQRQVDMSHGLIEPDRAVPQTTYWLYVDGHPVGMGKLRHRLNDDLRKLGGHLGYAIRPTERGKGYGTLICAELLKKAKEKAIPEALITCREDNLRSRKVIERNGGRGRRHRPKASAATGSSCKKNETEPPRPSPFPIRYSLFPAVHADGVGGGGTTVGRSHRLRPWHAALSLRRRVEGGGEDFVHVGDELEGQVSLDVGRDFFVVPAILLGQDDGGHARAVGGQHLLFDPADGQHLAAQRHLSGHRHVPAHRALGQGRDDRGGHGDAGRRAVLGNLSRGHVHVHVGLVVEVLVNPELGGPGAGVASSPPCPTPASRRPGGR